MGRHEALSKLAAFGRWCVDFGKVLISAFSGMGKDNITIVASGMVYSTLIAFVPCLTFLFSFLSAFGVSEALLEIVKDWLLATFGSDTGGALTDYLELFSRNAMSLGIAGLGSFIVTGIMLVNKIFTTLNQIFHTKPTSGTVQRFSTFLTFILVTCALIGVSFVLTQVIKSFVYKLAEGNPLFRVGGPKFLKQIGYFTVIGLLLFLLYKFVPRAKIRFTSALAGAVVGVIALWAAVKIFGEVSSRMVNYSVIYGSLASLFIALLFLYIAWYIILFCAELVYVHQFRPERAILLGHPETPFSQISVAVGIILMIADKYQRGLGSMSLKELMQKQGVPSVTLNSYLSDFEDAKLIMAVNATRSAYAPSKPLDQIYLSDIISTVYGNMGDSEIIGERIASEFLRSGLAGKERITVEDLLERT